MAKPLLVYYNKNGRIVKLSKNFLHQASRITRCITVNNVKLENDLLQNKENFTVENDKIVRLIPPTNQSKIAMITPYGVNCGIATYAQFLCDEIKPLVKELKIFAEHNNDETPEFDKEHNVLRCWDRKGSIKQLLDSIREYNPDTIYVQHEYGSFNNGSKWNALIGHLHPWRTIAVLHSVYEHSDKLIFEAPCKEIIVHSSGGRDLLRKKGIDHATIHMIPHGCLKPIVPPKNFRFSRIGSKHVLFQYGFGFEYKGWENALDIAGTLKETYPDIMYIGIFNVADRSKEFCINYHRKLMEEVTKRGLEDNFVLHLGFRSEEILLSYMQQAQVCIYPYWNHKEWRVWGASGAIRLALASGTPVLVSDVPFFEEFKEHLPICQTSEDYSKIITKIFNDEEYNQTLKNKINSFINNRSWEKTARWYLSCKPDKDFTAPVGDEYEN